MDFIQRAGKLLRDRLGGHIDIRPQMDTHPLQRYARDFLQTVLDYAAALDDGGLLASVKMTL